MPLVTVSPFIAIDYEDLPQFQAHNSTARHIGPRTHKANHNHATYHPSPNKRATPTITVAQKTQELPPSLPPPRITRTPAQPAARIPKPKQSPPFHSQHNRRSPTMHLKLHSTSLHNQSPRIEAFELPGS
jgi:hypothetical protein